MGKFSVVVDFSENAEALIEKMIDALKGVQIGGPIDDALTEATLAEPTAEEKKAAAAKKKKDAAAAKKKKDAAGAKPKKMTKPQLTAIKTKLGACPDLDKAALLGILADQFDGAESISALDASQVDAFIMAIGVAAGEDPEADPLEGLI